MKGAEAESGHSSAVLAAAMGPFHSLSSHREPIFSHSPPSLPSLSPPAQLCRAQSVWAPTSPFVAGKQHPRLERHQEAILPVEHCKGLAMVQAPSSGGSQHFGKGQGNETHQRPQAVLSGGSSPRGCSPLRPAAPTTGRLAGRGPPRLAGGAWVAS